MPIIGDVRSRSSARSPADAAAVCAALCEANKNDATDAEAICEAVTRPTMRFVPIKSVEQQRC